MSKLRRSLSRLRSELDGLLRRVPDPGGPEVSHLSDEELDRLEELLVRHMVQEGEAGALRYGAHGPGGRLENCDCGYCDRETAPLTAEERNELVYLLRLAQA